MVGQTISHYRIVEKLGEGGMGVVYKAEDTKLERTVALKFLASHLLGDEVHKARFLQEAKAAAALDHPNIATIHEIDEANGQTFLAMACLEGQTLKQKIAARPLPLGEALDIALQIGQGLQAAHEKGVVHRDIKPGNIMITPQGQVKIMDFGLAEFSDRTKLTATGVKLGTPAYMSPEQTEGKAADRRSDIWSLGVVLYEMISGRVPFPGEAEAAVTYAIVHTEPEPLTALRTGLPIEIDRIIAKAFGKDRGERYQHVEDMLVDLRAITKEEATLLRTPRKRRRAVVLGSCALVIAAVGTYALYNGATTGTQNLGPRSSVKEGLLTSFEGSEGYPTFSPDGNQVAFSWDGPDTDNFDIYITSTEGGDPLRVTTDSARDFAPAWSPDGRYIAFLRELPGGIGLFLMPPTGGTSESWRRAKA